MADEEDFAREVADIFKEQIAPLRHRIEQLEREVAELKTKGIEYKGVWQRACDYPRGSVTTWDGSMWAAIQDIAPNTQPGTSQSWQLCCRAGRDLRDAKGAQAA